VRPKAHVHRDLLERLEPGWQKTIAAAPYRRPTRDERNRFRSEYREKYFLLPAEIYPRDPWEISPFDKAMNNLPCR